MKLREAVLSGVIGTVCGLIAIWLVFGIFKVPVEMTNVYIVVGFASFFGSFFASLFAGNAKCKVKITE